MRSMQRSDTFEVMDGEAQSTEEPNEAEKIAPLLTLGLPYTPGRILM